MNRLLLLGCYVFAMVLSAQAQLQIEPTPERFAEAVELLTKEQQVVLKRRLSYRLDASQAVFHEPLDELSKKPFRRFLKIGHEQFVAYLNKNLVEPNARFVRLNELQIYVASNNDTGRASSLFTIKLTISNAAGKIVRAEGFASGPRYSVFKVWNASKNPASVRSENLGYFAAFLEVAINLEKQLNEPTSQP